MSCLEGGKSPDQGSVVPHRVHNGKDCLGSDGGVLVDDDQVCVGGAGDDLVRAVVPWLVWITIVSVRMLRLANAHPVRAGIPGQ